MKISFDETVKRLMKGSVVAIPTETVYGLAARYDNIESIHKIFLLKNRPQENPLIIHLPDATAVTHFTKNVPEGFYPLAKAFWPGPLTLVIPIDPATVSSIVRSGLQSQAFRVPSHPLALELIKKTGPLVAPSANLSGRPSSAAAKHVEQDFGEDFPVLDGGASLKGVESTILIFDGNRWRLGRLGAIAPKDFEAVIGYVPEPSLKGKRPLCPGQLYRHYAPLAKLHLGSNVAKAKTIIGFSDRQYPPGKKIITWGSSQNPGEVLSNLYETLRNLDLEQIQEVFIDVDFPNEGLWLTLLERLEKASKGDCYGESDKMKP